MHLLLAICPDKKKQKRFFVRLDSQMSFQFSVFLSFKRRESLSFVVKSNMAAIWKPIPGSVVVCEGVYVHENCVSVPGSIKTGTNCTHISSGQFYSVCLKAVRRR